jgi:hypothetical protein
VRVIVAAAGEAARWGNYLGVPKQLVPIPPDGEPLLHRTVRQARDILGSIDVHVVARGDERFAVDGATTHHVGASPSEYASSRPFWATAGRTVLLLGDCYFSDAAMTTIAAHREREYRCFGRYGPSRQTHKRYGEIFAVSWWPAQHRIVDRHLAHAHGLIASGKSNRPPGWLLLRLMQGTAVARHAVRAPWFVTIDDWTDDFDVPVDYDVHPAVAGARV